jgi:hypothetical protein
MFPLYLRSLCFRLATHAESTTPPSLRFLRFPPHAWRTPLCHSSNSSVLLINGKILQQASFNTRTSICTAFYMLGCCVCDGLSLSRNEWGAQLPSGFNGIRYCVEPRYAKHSAVCHKGRVPRSTLHVVQSITREERVQSHLERAASQSGPPVDLAATSAPSRPSSFRQSPAKLVHM